MRRVFPLSYFVSFVLLISLHATVRGFDGALVRLATKDTLYFIRKRALTAEERSRLERSVGQEVTIEIARSAIARQVPLDMKAKAIAK